MNTKIATIVVLAAGLVVARLGRKQAAVPEDPRAVIYEMLNAAKAGDRPRYLEAFAQPMVATLEPTISANYLLDTSALIKGVACSDPLRITDGESSVQVQFIYEDRTDAQTFYLSRGDSGWKIARMEDAQRAKTLVPYGTPVRLTHRNPQ